MVNLKELEEYINLYAWNYGRFYHVGSAERILEKVSERMELPEEFLKKHFKELKILQNEKRKIKISK